MKKIVVIVGMCVAIVIYVFSVTPKKAIAMPGECNFNVDCGVGMKCVGQYGKKYCVPNR
jgi:hypothetical protein